MTSGKPVAIGAWTAVGHLMLCVVTLVAQGRTLGLEARESLSLGGPWQALTFPLVPIYRIVTESVQAWLPEILLVLALNSCLWGVAIGMLAAAGLPKRGRL